jgi:hypothetical protein
MIQFDIRVTVKTRNGSFGATRENHYFSFCCESVDQARALALANVPARGFPYDEKILLVEAALPVSR